MPPGRSGFSSSIDRQRSPTPAGKVRGDLNRRRQNALCAECSADNNFRKHSTSNVPRPEIRKSPLSVISDLLFKNGRARTRDGEDWGTGTGTGANGERRCNSDFLRYLCDLCSRTGEREPGMVRIGEQEQTELTEGAKRAAEPGPKGYCLAAAAAARSEV